MFSKERPLPKALNIIRPTPPPLFTNTQDSSSTASSPSDISTISNISNFSNSRPQPTLFNPTNFFQNNVNTFKASSVNTVGVNPHRFLQRPRSNSSLSRSTFFTAFSDNNNPTTTTHDDIIDEYDELDSIDGMTDEEEEEEEEEEEKIVARMKHGTIMNGKGEFVNKGDHDPWSDEARANRKIADLEIENKTLVALNMSLESKLREQLAQIGDLEKKLQNVTETPLTPISDKHVDDDDEVTLNNSISDTDKEAEASFLRIKSTLESLIEQAESSLIENSIQPKSKPTVISRRASDNNLTRQSFPPSTQSRHSTTPSMRRTTTPVIRRSTTPSMRNSITPIPQRPSSRLSNQNNTRKQEPEKPKWSF